MKKYLLASLIALISMLVMQTASAHENRTYQIGHDVLQFTVGSLNEPIAVDDKTGVYFKVVEPGAPTGGEEDHDAGGAVEGLDKTLKVEVIAGDKKKVMELAPIHGEAGAYRASFIPTVQTTYVYRFFGTISDKPIDVSFTCNPAGHPVSPEDTKSVKLSDGVTQLKKTGAFGCPVAKGDLGFPEAAASEYEIGQAVIQGNSTAKSARIPGVIGMVLGALGLVAGAGAWMKIKQRV